MKNALPGGNSENGVTKYGETEKHFRGDSTEGSRQERSEGFDDKFILLLLRSPTELPIQIS